MDTQMHLIIIFALLFLQFYFAAHGALINFEPPLTDGNTMYCMSVRCKGYGIDYRNLQYTMVVASTNLSEYKCPQPVYDITLWIVVNGPNGPSGVDPSGENVDIITMLSEKTLSNITLKNDFGYIIDYEAGSIVPLESPYATEDAIEQAGNSSEHATEPAGTSEGRRFGQKLGHNRKSLAQKSAEMAIKRARKVQQKRAMLERFEKLRAEEARLIAEQRQLLQERTINRARMQELNNEQQALEAETARLVEQSRDSQMLIALLSWFVQNRNQMEPEQRVLMQIALMRWAHRRNAP